MKACKGQSGEYFLRILASSANTSLKASSWEDGGGREGGEENELVYIRDTDILGW